MNMAVTRKFSASSVGVAVGVALSATLMASCAIANDPAGQNPQIPQESAVQLGTFSTSLSVKDIKASQEFYEKLGFEIAGGNIEQNWLILRNGSTTIGLFQGMFEQNIMTFNPGWNERAEPLQQFEDVRDVQSKLKARGIELTTEAEAGETGPASFTLQDPDGNQILIDQHVPKAQ